MAIKNRDKLEKDGEEMEKEELKAYRQLCLRKEKLESELQNMIVNRKADDHIISDKKRTLEHINGRLMAIDSFIEEAFGKDELIGNILYAQYKEHKTIERIAEEQHYCVRTINNKLGKFWKSMQ